MRGGLHYSYWASAVLLTVFLELFLGRTIAVDTKAQSNYSIDGELSGVKLSLFSPQGDRLYYLESDTLSHFSEEESMHLSPLRIIHTTPEGTLITLESDTGQVLSAGTLIELEGKVYINKFISPDQPVHTAKTSQLFVDTKSRLATTEEKAVIQWGTQVFSGTGMEIDLNNGKIRLLNDVEVGGGQE